MILFTFTLNLLDLHQMRMIDQKILVIHTFGLYLLKEWEVEFCRHYRLNAESHSISATNSLSLPTRKENLSTHQPIIIWLLFSPIPLIEPVHISSKSCMTSFVNTMLQHPSHSYQTTELLVLLTRSITCTNEAVSYMTFVVEKLV